MKSSPIVDEAGNKDTLSVAGISMKERLIESEETQMNMSIPKRKLSKLIRVIIVVVILLVISIVTFTLSSVGAAKKIPSFIPPVHKEASVEFDESTGTFVFTDRDLDEKYISISFPYKLGKTFFEPSCDEFVETSILTKEKHKQAELKVDKPQICLAFQNDIKVAVYQDNIGIECHTVHWFSSNVNSEISNCVDIKDEYWYGGGSLSIQRWPLNRVNVPLQPYITRKFKPQQSDDAMFDSFIEPYFTSASGVVILVDPYLPLFVSINHNNNKKMCFKSAYQTPYNIDDNVNNITLKYKVCKDRRARTAHWHFLEWKILDHSIISPPDDMLLKPIWSTRGINVDGINESSVISLKEKIIKSKIPYSMLLIDGNYTKASGNFYFNDKKFPHSAQMIMEFESNDKLPVGTEIFPIISASKETVHYALKSNQAFNTSSPIYLDTSNKKATSWYASQLKEISSELRIKAFRFSGGQVSELKQVNKDYKMHSNSSFHLNNFTTAYSAIAGEFGDRCLVGSGFKSQKHTVIADAGPMQSTWDHNKGLKSIIPTTLTYGLMGYPFVLAGPVGGVNMAGQTLNGDFSPPDKELYIRWLQIAVFNPVIEFSAGAWNYGEDVVNYTRKLLEYREDVLWPNYLSSAVSEATEVGTPIMRPLWFIFPDDKTAQYIDCEFFLSNTLLVAPVLNPKDRQRDVYLPEGLWWKDQLHNKYYTGGQWLRDFPVDLYEIATFIQERPEKNEILK